MREGTHEDPGGTPDIDNGFESDDPQARIAGIAADGGAAAPETAADADASRAVQEADIVKVVGDRLYALSKYGGLAVIDLSNPDRLRLLGRKRLDAVPFEMYVEGSHAFVMLNDYARWVQEGNTGRWVDTSEILALDVTDPASIAETAHFDVPGRIADSRMVGDVAYVVTYERGCYSCQDELATVVTSFHLGAAITRRDQVLFASPTTSSWSWQRSVAASDKRLYVAGPDYGWNPGQSNVHSTVQVVDITDPSGKLTRGADVHVEGGIESRWQIDEHEGVLRVVSQFGGRWGGGSTNPRVQTFTIASSASITPLGQTELVLPMPETLRSVRFDGSRAYAITAQQTDPLFTIDLSNPAAPKQVGTLEMPGWIFHLEPRGDRVVGFGYEGSDLAVSLFDVTNPAAPSMLKRVRFGGGWSSLPEDQDRIHKAVQVLDGAGLVLVPFASYGSRSNGECGQPRSGIQLIDYSRDDLVLRGVAPQWGMPRRALVAKNRLLAMSDRNVTAFDLASRDAPVKTNELDLSNPAYRLAELPDHIASITNDWWTGEAMLSLTPKANVDDAQAVGKLSLKSLSPATCAGGWASWYEARLLASGSMLYVAVPVFGSTGAELVTAAIDVSDPAHPRIAGRASSPFVHREYVSYGCMFWEGWSLYSYFGGYGSSLLTTGEGLVRVGTKLAYLEVANEWSSTWLGEARASKLHRVLHVVDFADPAAPVVHPPLALKESLGASPLHVYEGKVLTTRWIHSNVSPRHAPS